MNYSKLDFWFGFGMGGGNHFFTGNIGVGYLQKLNRKFYLNTGIHLSGYDYTLSSFKVDELKNFNSSSQFVYTSWCLNPRLELMCRKLSNNVWGTQFLKLGIGAYIDLSNSKWKYEIGQDAVDNKGNHYTKYVFSQNLNSMPTFSKCIFYLSLSYSLFAFEKQ